MVTSTTLTTQARHFIDELNARDINPFVSAAKIGLVVACSVFVMVILLAAGRRDLNSMVGAAQGLTVVCLSVMGWHGYKGCQMLYLIRHMGQNNILDAAESHPK